MPDFAFLGFDGKKQTLGVPGAAPGATAKIAKNEQKDPKKRSILCPITVFKTFYTFLCFDFFTSWARTQARIGGASKINDFSRVFWGHRLHGTVGNIT